MVGHGTIRGTKVRYCALVAPPRAYKPRGRIETLPSGSLRVKVFAGIDPVSGRKHVLTEVIPPGPLAERQAERARTKRLAEVDERRNPRTSATIEHLTERHLGMLDVVPTTMCGYEG